MRSCASSAIRLCATRLPGTGFQIYTLPGAATPKARYIRSLVGTSRSLRANQTTASALVSLLLYSLASLR